MSCWFSGPEDDHIKILPMVKSMWVTLQKSLKSYSTYFYPVTDRMWATLHILWKAPDHIVFYDQQGVSIAHFVKGCLITSFLMTNRKWVALHMMYERKSNHIFSYGQQEVSDIAHFVRKGVSLHPFLWPTASQWCCRFCERYIFSSHLLLWPTGSKWCCIFVSSHLWFMTNRKWVTLHILWKAVWSHLSLWPTGCEWHCIFGESQSGWSHLFL